VPTEFDDQIARLREEMLTAVAHLREVMDLNFAAIAMASKIQDERNEIHFTALNHEADRVKQVQDSYVLRGTHEIAISTLTDKLEAARRELDAKLDATSKELALRAEASNKEVTTRIDELRSSKDVADGRRTVITVLITVLISAAFWALTFLTRMHS
jgi:chemotaxis response regulator CheB